MTDEQKMKQRVYRYVMVYVALLILLSAWGAQNQKLHDHHADLIERKQDLLLQRADLNGLSARVTGAAAVRSWALSQGMVPAPEGQEAQPILAQASPELSSRRSGLEVFTEWR